MKNTMKFYLSSQVNSNSTGYSGKIGRLTLRVNQAVNSWILAWNNTSRVNSGNIQS